MPNLRLSLFPLLATVALTACGTAPGTGTGTQPVTTDRVSGTLDVAAGTTVSATAHAPTAATNFVDLGSVAVDADGSFTLLLPASVGPEYLAPASDHFGCADLPDADLTMLTSLDVEGQGYAMLVPEGTSNGTFATDFYVFVYSDAAVEIDTTCGPSVSGSGLAASRVDSTNILALHFAVGWNLVRVQQGSSSTSFETMPLLASFLWLLFPYN